MKNQETRDKTIVVGIDPAPSKGLCVDAYYPVVNSISETKFKRYYKSTVADLEEFEDMVKELAMSCPVLICWDAPLTMPSGFHRRKIEETAKISPVNAHTPRNDETKEKREHIKMCKNAMASVQPMAECSHWVISQYLFGYPSFKEAASSGKLNAKLIFDADDISESGIYMTEVHPALAIQVGVGQHKIMGFKSGGKLSGDYTYKNAKWNSSRTSSRDMREGFRELVKAVKEKYGGDCEMLEQIFQEKVSQWKKPEGKSKLDPSDYLDAWVAMRLGMRWLKNESVECFGDKEIGSFLLPTGNLAAEEERPLLKKLRGGGELI